MNKQSEESFSKKFADYIDRIDVSGGELDDYLSSVLVRDVVEFIDQKRQQAYQEGRREGMVEALQELQYHMIGSPQHGKGVPKYIIDQKLAKLTSEQQEDTLIQKNGEEHE